MLKRFNMLALIVLLVFQTMIAPVAATAKGVEQDDSHVATAEKLDNEEVTDVPEEEVESAENEGTDADEVESAEDGAAEGENEGDTNESEDATEEESSEADAEVDGVDAIEESEENAEVTGENEGEENTSKKRAAVIYEATDLGNIFTFEYFKINGENGEDVEDGAEIEFNVPYALQYKWDTNELAVKAGDTARLPLPDVFEHFPSNTPALPIKTSDGTVVGEYTIHSGELVFVFNAEIENAAVQNGFVGFNVNFNNEKFLEEWEQDIDFDASGTKDLTVVVKPGKVETSLDKEGHPDSGKDAKEITWSIDITNGSEEDIANGVLKDILPEGLGEPRDFVVKELTFDFEGNKIVGEVVEFNEPTVDANGFEMTFNNVPARGGYTVEYTTTITDYEISEFTNDATFTYDGKKLEIDKTVDTGERSNPIQKSGSYNSRTGQIDWTIVVNENGLDIEKAIVHDELLLEELTLVEESIKVTKNWNEVEGLNPTEFPITLGKVNADEVYRINFSTEIDWSKVNGGKYQQGDNKFTNETELTDGEDPRGKGVAEVDVWRENLLSKSGNANDYNYENKTLSWTIDVNKAKHPINGAVITDTLPAGLDIKESDIVIKNEVGEDVTAENIAITKNDDGTEVTIELGDIGTETLKVTYQTKVEDFEADSFTNEAGLEGDGVGESIPKDNAPVYPPGNSFTKDFKGIDYSEKTMDWNITVNPQREAITELEIKDTFPNKGMILLPDSVVVKIGEIKLAEGTDYKLVPNVDGEETGYNKGFTINLTKISEASPLNERLTVDFKTSYDPQLDVDGSTLDDHIGDSNLYKNHADFTGETVNGNKIKKEDDAQTTVREDSWNSGKKEGQLVHVDEEGKLAEGWESGSERKIAWQVYTNYQKQDLGTEVVVADVLGYEGIIDKDSIVVKVYNVNSNGDTEITSKELSSGDYTVTFEEGGAEFSLEFANSVTERYVIEFTTTVPDISEKSYTNEATVKVGEGEYPFSGTVNYDKWDDYLDKQALGQEGNDVFIGEELEWEVTVNENLSTIKNAVITDTISAGLAYLDESLAITTGSESELVEGEDYTLEVTTTDAGETVLKIDFTNDVTETLTLNYTTVVIAENGQQVNNKVDLNGDGVDSKSKETNKLTAKQFSWVGGEYNPNRGAIVVEKVDSEGNVIETSEASFELYFEMNEERVLVGEYSTENGVLEIPNLPLRTYYLVEVEAPEGYVLTDQEIEIDVHEVYGESEKVFDVSVTNYKEDEEPELTEVSVEKVWEGEAQNSVTINLLADGKEVKSEELSDANDWNHTFTNLPAVDADGNDIEYTVEEVEVDGYNTDITGDAKEGFTITNTQKTYAIGDYTWIDSNKDGIQDEDEEVLIGVIVELYDESGENKLDETTTDENGLYIFDELLAGKYTVKFTLTEEQAEKYVFTKQNADENSTKDSDADPETGFTKVIELNDDNEHLTKEYKDQDFKATEGIDPTWDAGVIEKTPITPIEPAKTKVSVEKVWKGAEQEEVTINLLADGIEVDSKELSDENDWKHTFTNLPVVNDVKDEKEIEYTVEEVKVDGYNTDITGDAKEGFTITNTQKTYAIGDYTWIDSNKDGIQDEDEEVLIGVIVELYDESGENKLDETTTDENGLYIFDELPAGKYTVKFTLTDEQKEKYVFTKQNADENSTKDSDADPETGFTRVIELNDENEHLTKEYKDQDFKATEGIDPTWDAGVIEKTPVTPIEPAKTKVSVEKVWEGEAQDEVTINLLADGEKVASVDLSEENEWKHTFTDLPTVHEITDEKAIEYTVEEVKVDGYNTEITGDAKEGFTITNTQKTYAIGDYTWIDSNKDGIQDEDEEVLPGVKVELFDEDGKKIAETETDKNGLYIFDELPAGKYTVKFTLTDEQKEKYEFTKQNADENSTKDSDADPETGWTKVIELNDENKHLTKDYTDQDFKATEGIDPTWDAGVIEKTPVTPIEPAKTKVSVEKVWEGDKQDEVTINLLADGKEVGSKVLSEENKWKHTFTDLPTVHKITDEKAIEYTVEEVKVDGYNTEITGDAKDGFTITNTQKTYAIGDYTWIDSNKDGIQDEDEEVLVGVIVELYDESGENKLAETTTDEDGLYIFDELPAGKYTVKFTLTEEQAAKYVFTKQNVGDDSTVDSDADPVTGFTKVIELNDENEHLTKDYTDQDFGATEGIDPTWDAGVIEKTPVTPIEPAKTKVSVEKVWVGAEQDEVTINLLADGKEVDSVELSDANDWEHTFTNLPVVNDVKDEKAIEYTVEEVKVDGYNTEITGDAKEGFTITNTQKTYAIGDYTWIDSNKDGIQDEDEEVLPGVKVELFDEDGNKIAETETDKNGRYIFDELPAGKYKVKFTLTDEQAKKYKFTKQNAGDDSTVDSDADEKGWTVVFELNDDNKHLTKDYTDQAFKATEGIDPTWDAGVIEITQIDPEEPVDPEDPQDPEDPEDPEKPTPGEDPKDPEEPEVGGDPEDPKVDGTGDNLPETATNIYNLTLIGFGLMLLGLILFLVRRKRIE